MATPQRDFFSHLGVCKGVVVVVKSIQESQAFGTEPVKM